MIHKKPPSQRQQRVNELIRQAITSVFSDIDILDAKLPSLSLLTINEVSISPDLKQAKVYINGFASKVDINQFSHILNDNKKCIRFLMAKKLALKHTPNIHFIADNTADFAADIDKILSSGKVAADIKKEED
jgi:ribosome-binding factor A